MKYIHINSKSEVIIFMQQIHKFLDTSNLPKSNGKSQHINWKECIGKSVYFEYDDLNGYIKILDYKSAYKSTQNQLSLQYNDTFITTCTSNFLKLKIPTLFNRQVRTLKYKYSVSDIVINGNDRMLILEQIRINYITKSNRGYKVKCLDCNHEYRTLEQKFSSCPICGRRSSFAERFIYNMLFQAGIIFEPQKEFEWLSNHYYDVYLPKQNIIIEIHGIQHYEIVGMYSRLQPEEIYSTTIKRDIKKHDAAIDKLNYYILNATSVSKSRFNDKKIDIFIKEIKTTLPFIDYSKVNFLECEKFANYKYIFTECQLWNSGKSIDEIQQNVHKSKEIISLKLRLGNKYGLCVYDKTLNNKHNKIFNPNISA